MLVLFDVDATLITTSRVGVMAMGRAGRQLFGPSFDENVVEYAGRLDPLIIVDLLRAHKADEGQAAIDGFRAAYREHLTTLLGDWEGKASPCPGIPELLDELERQPGVTMGLLTGNYPETGAIKLRACGIEPERFPIRVWGDESPVSPPARTHLPPVGMERYRRAHGRGLEAADVTIIGDTPHDIACARAHGCRSIGVATGRYTVAELAESGADLAAQDLTDTKGVVQWLTHRAGTPRTARPM